MATPRRRTRKPASLLTVVLISIGPVLLSMAIEAAANVVP